MADPQPAAPLRKFQDLLRELFQFDRADLDFGIYRIMNHKRDVVEKFISEKLPEAVNETLKSGAIARQVAAKAAFDEARQMVVEVLGAKALTPEGEISNNAFANTPVAAAYLDARRRAGAARSREALETDTYNHLYTFFRRYYQDGDFVAKRRYSRNERYAIPYNGEEVYLHWANRDQYYVKTAEHFHRYRWKAPAGITVEFRVESADIEQDNVKGDRRYFIPRVKGLKWNDADRNIYMPFGYRPLTAAEQREFRGNGIQERIIDKAVRELPSQMTNAEARAALTGEHRKNIDGTPISRLEHHLRRYTRRNDSDFFIHRDLGGFLTRELDFYIKNEVLNLDNLELAGERPAEGWFQLLQLIRTVGVQVIDFLAQIEGFQRMLWEKRKFVTSVHYCIAVGEIDSALYREFLANDAQWAEWQSMLPADGGERSEATLTAHPTLMMDTRHFDADTVDRVVASFTDVDEVTDGVLIAGDNWQAMALLRNRFLGSIGCLYIDPPYNTGDSEILYKNGYLSSSWLAMMHNRLASVVPLLTDDPTCYIAIDDFEMADLCLMVDKYFPSLRREMIIVNHHPQGGKATTLSTTHEYMLTCVSRSSRRALRSSREALDVERRPFQRAGTAESNFRRARPNSFYAILVDSASGSVVGIEKPPAPHVMDYPTEDTPQGYVRIYPVGTAGDERVWRRAYESAVELVERGALVCPRGRTVYHLIRPDERNPAVFSNWTDSRYNAGTFGAALLGDILGRHNPFPYPKSIHTVADAIHAHNRTDMWCMDFFGGSGTTGHAIAHLNRRDGGNRRFILVEAGEQFETVLLPRVKRVAFAPEWKEGRPSRLTTAVEAKRSPRIIKYLGLESYEDAMDSIQFDEKAGALGLEDRIEGYLLKYMLKWETKDSATLLNPVELASPFDYRLRVHSNGNTVDRPVDVAETFNYLLGLRVRTRRVYMDEGRRYLVYRGETREAEGKTVVVIWRDTKGWGEEELMRDKKFVSAQGITEGADTIYVNGMSGIVGGKQIEPLFKERMFAGVESSV